MKQIGIVGDGYTAAELLRILLNIDEYEVSYLSSADHIGMAITELYPQLTGLSDLYCETTDQAEILRRCEGVFLALPHGQSVALAAELTAAGLCCVDLGADFRLKDPELYRHYYELEHTRPDLLSTAVYGIPELYRTELKATKLAANPGCFPTSAILPLVPLLQCGLINPSSIIVDAKSGVSGAGRGMKDSSHYCSVNEGVHPYGIGTHRHAPEIRQQLELAAGTDIGLIFTPHLVPMSRGILSTIYAHVQSGVQEEEVRQALERAYAEEFFIHLLPAGAWPHTRWVYGSNHVQIALAVDEASGMMTMACAIDNLCRGASAQAVQNMNIMMDLPEDRGLKMIGLYP